MKLKSISRNPTALLERQCTRENQISNQSAKMASRDSSVLISEEHLEELSETFGTVSTYKFVNLQIFFTIPNFHNEITYINPN